MSTGNIPGINSFDAEVAYMDIKYLFRVERISPDVYHTRTKGHALVSIPPMPNSRQGKPTVVLTPISTRLVTVDVFSDTRKNSARHAKEQMSMPLPATPLNAPPTKPSAG